MKIIALLWLVLANVFVSGHMEPFKNELLNKPINLCENVKLVELHRSISDRQLQDLQETCIVATSNFNRFLDYKNLDQRDIAGFKWQVSFLPIDSQYRHLNDLKYRFINRSHFKNVSTIPGYNNPQIKMLFVQDDLEDEHTKTIFAHELFHAMSWQFGIFRNVEADEKLAVEFTNFIGLGT